MMGWILGKEAGRGTGFTERALTRLTPTSTPLLKSSKAAMV